MEAKIEGKEEKQNSVKIIEIGNQDRIANIVLSHSSVSSYELQVNTEGQKYVCMYINTTKTKYNIMKQFKYLNTSKNENTLKKQIT